MGAPITLRDVVGKRQHRFVVTVVPPHGHFNANAISFTLNINRLWHHGCFVAVDIFHKLADTTFVEQF